MFDHDGPRLGYKPDWVIIWVRGKMVCLLCAGQPKSYGDVTKSVNSQVNSRGTFLSLGHKRVNKNICLQILLTDNKILQNKIHSSKETDSRGTPKRYHHHQIYGNFSMPTQAGQLLPKSKLTFSGTSTTRVNSIGYHRAVVCPFEFSAMFYRWHAVAYATHLLEWGFLSSER